MEDTPVNLGVSEHCKQRYYDNTFSTTSTKKLHVNVQVSNMVDNMESVDPAMKAWFYPAKQV